MQVDMKNINNESGPLYLGMNPEIQKSRNPEIKKSRKMC